MKNTSTFIPINWLLTAVLFLRTITGSAQFQKGNDIDGEAAGDWSGYSVSMPDDNTVAIGAIYSDGSAAADMGHVRVYVWNGTAWAQKGNDIDGEAAGDWSGNSVSMPDANTLAIGAPNNDGKAKDAGHVRVYSWNGASWVQKGADIEGEAVGDFSGNSISMPDANTVAIGAPNNDGNGSNSGHVRVYAWNGSAWVQKGSDIDGEATDDFSGLSVSMPDVNTVAIGAPNNDGRAVDAGHVRVYAWNGAFWVQKGVDIDGETAGDAFGFSICLTDSNTLAIGARFSNGYTGHVSVFFWNGMAWVQKGSDIDGEAEFDYSGTSVSMPDNNTLAIGAFRNDGNGINSGHVRVYSWSGSSWEQKGMDINGEAADDWCGLSVSMPNGNMLAIGAPGSDSKSANTGNVRVYSINFNVGLWENSFGPGMKAFPNPTRGELNLELGAICDRVRVTVYNALGQIVLNEAFGKASALQIQIPGPAGVYSVEVSSEGKQAMLRVNKW
jgi:hypothetical protein